MVGQTAQDGALTATVAYLPSQLLARLQGFLRAVRDDTQRSALQEAVWNDGTHWSVGLGFWRKYDWTVVTYVDGRNDLWNSAPPAPILLRRELLRRTVVPPVYVSEAELVTSTLGRI